MPIWEEANIKKELWEESLNIIEFCGDRLHLLLK